MAMRIRNITTGCGTLFPTRSTVSRALCVIVFDGGVFVASLRALMSEILPLH
jgi:hypothetical protein